MNIETLTEKINTKPIYDKFGQQLEVNDIVCYPVKGKLEQAVIFEIDRNNNQVILSNKVLNSTVYPVNANNTILINKILEEQHIDNTGYINEYHSKLSNKINDKIYLFYGVDIDNHIDGLIFFKPQYNTSYEFNNDINKIFQKYPNILLFPVTLRTSQNNREYLAEHIFRNQYHHYVDTGRYFICRPFILDAKFNTGNNITRTYTYKLTSKQFKDVFKFPVELNTLIPFEFNRMDTKDECKVSLEIENNDFDVTFLNHISTKEFYVILKWFYKFYIPIILDLFNKKELILNKNDEYLFILNNSTIKEKYI